MNAVIFPPSDSRVYTVTAFTGIGGETFGLKLVDNETISDLADNPLGGAGPVNGDFTGEAFTIERAPVMATVAVENLIGVVSTPGGGINKAEVEALTAKLNAALRLIA